ncbi:6-phosphofructo-2-kinase-domain-containing protein [Mortierella sp. GBAus27b]|nr:6-phosphofructo-2-kinase-domain-containing protein [Mortierella sp. GBAus27b]
MFPGQLYKTESGRLFHAGAIAIILVGLPARGKTAISRSLCRYLRWLGVQTRVFSVGNYRRQIVGVEIKNDFFSPANTATAGLRAQIANACLDDMVQWFSQGGQVGILDGSNTTEERRTELVERFKTCNVQSMFIETICDNPDIIDANIRNVKVSSPDYVGWDRADAVEDFKRRIQNHVPFYKTLRDLNLSFVKVINAGEKIIVNNVHGFLQSKIVYYLTNLHISPRTIYFARNGVSLDEYSYRADSPLAPAGHRYAENLKNFLLTLRESSPMSSPTSTTPETPRRLTVWTSSRKRSFQTAAHFLDHEEIIVRQRTVLAERNPGVCDQMTEDEIQEKYPDECLRASKDPYRHRFPRSESYYDLANRLEKVILELEREKNDVLIVAHMSVIRCLYGYLHGLPEADIPSLEIPEGVLLELRPTAYAIEEKRYKIPDDVPSVNWQQQAANFMSLAGSIPASPLFMDHYLPDSPETPSPSSSIAPLSSTTSPTSAGTQKQIESFSQGPELSLQL